MVEFSIHFVFGNRWVCLGIRYTSKIIMVCLRINHYNFGGVPYSQTHPSIAKHKMNTELPYSTYVMYVSACNMARLWFSRGNLGWVVVVRCAFFSPATSEEIPTRNLTVCYWKWIIDDKKMFSTFIQLNGVGNSPLQALQILPAV